MNYFKIKPVDESDSFYLGMIQTILECNGTPINNEATETINDLIDKQNVNSIRELIIKAYPFVGILVLEIERQSSANWKESHRRNNKEKEVNLMIHAQLGYLVQAIMRMYEEVKKDMEMTSEK